MQKNVFYTIVIEKKDYTSVQFLRNDNTVIIYLLINNYINIIGICLILSSKNNLIVCNTSVYGTAVCYFRAFY